MFVQVKALKKLVYRFSSEVLDFKK